MDELQELYRQVILDHNRNPRNFGALADATRVVAGVNPLCGDKMTLYVKLGNGKIEDIRLPNRAIVGTWKSQRENGAFRITRQ